MKKKYVFIIFILLLIIGFCVYFFLFRTVTYKPQISNKAATHTLKIQDSISFALDEKTNPYVSETQYIQTDSVAYLTFLNQSSQSIYWYDFKTKKIAFQTPLSKEGANGVDIISGYKIINKDTIIVYSYRTSVVSMVDIKGNLKKKIGSYAQIVPNAKYAGAPSGKYGSELIFHKNQIYGATFNADPNLPGEDSLNRPILVSISSLTGKMQAFLGRPSIYRETYWGGLQMQQVFTTYNPAQGKIIFSFPILAEIFVYDIKNQKIETYQAGSTLAKEVVSFPLNAISQKKVNQNIICQIQPMEAFFMTLIERFIIDFSPCPQ